jgi:hypothetical protein
MLAKVKVLQELGGSLDPAVREAAQAEALLPRVPLSQWKAKYFPEAAAQDLAPTAKLPDSGPGGRGPGPVMPSLPFNLADYKDKRIEDYITERNQYEAKLGKEKGVRSIKDIQADLEKFRTEAKERATTDKAAAQEAFQQEALLTAALAAPQFLKGRGLGQATARFAETASPGLMGAMQARKSSLLKKPPKRNVMLPTSLSWLNLILTSLIVLKNLASLIKQPLCVPMVLKLISKAL